MPSAIVTTHYRYKRPPRKKPIVLSGSAVVRIAQCVIVFDDFRPHGTAGLFFVTAKAARELDLTVRFRGGEHHRPSHQIHGVRRR